MTSILLDWVVVIYANTRFIVAWLLLFNFDRGLIGLPIDIKTILIQLWSNAPVYIYLVSTLELLPGVLDCLL